MRRKWGNIFIGLTLAASAATSYAAPSKLERFSRRPVETLSIGSAVAAPGQMARGILKVPAGADGGYDIPVIVVNGARPGPRLALVAGLHGAEFASVVALQQLADRIQPRNLAGSVIIVPLVNTSGFAGLTPRVNPVDGKNMNRHFPGTSTGTQTERASHVLTQEVLGVADYVIDYHGGDLNEDLHPYSYWIQTGNNETDAEHHALLRAFGSPFIIKYPAPDLTAATAKLLPTAAVVLGKPSITVMAGKAGRADADDIASLVDGTLRVLSELNMTRTAPPAAAAPKYVAKTVYVNSDVTGVFYPIVRPGMSVRRGQALGYVTDLQGVRVFDAAAPEDGVVLFRNSTAAAVKGEALFYLGVLEK